MERINLDYECAKFGQKIPLTDLTDVRRIKSTNENLITKALGVLQEDGVYAFMIYLSSGGAFDSELDDDEKVARSILYESVQILKELDILKGDFERENIYTQFRELTKNLDQLLFVKDILERTLIYARYHAKSLGE